MSQDITKRQKQLLDFIQKYAEKKALTPLCKKWRKPSTYLLSHLCITTSHGLEEKSLILSKLWYISFSKSLKHRWSNDRNFSCRNNRGGTADRSYRRPRADNCAKRQCSLVQVNILL